MTAERMRKRHPVPPVRIRRQIIGYAVLLLILLTAALALACDRGGENAALVTEEQLEARMDEVYAADPAIPDPLEMEDTIHVVPDEDTLLLAKIMQQEDGHDWPDWAVMAIGEVVLNRVASPEFPDTIREVLYQQNPTQYQPVYESSWESIVPEDRYIELAERLLDGERVLNDPEIIYQALFEQGRGTVVSYHDFYIGSTTYFCLTNSPGLYT